MNATCHPRFADTANLTESNAVCASHRDRTPAIVVDSNARTKSRVLCYRARWASGASPNIGPWRVWQNAQSCRTLGMLCISSRGGMSGMCANDLITRREPFRRGPSRKIKCQNTGIASDRRQPNESVLPSRRERSDIETVRKAATVAVMWRCVSSGDRPAQTPAATPWTNPASRATKTGHLGWDRRRAYTPLSFDTRAKPLNSNPRRPPR